MSAFRPLDDADVAGKRVLVRVDLNVPMEDGKVSDTTRIDRILPTIREIADKGGKVVLLAHFGRPKGRDDKNSLKQVVPALAHALERPVTFVEDCIGEDVAKAVAWLGDEDVAIQRRRREERSRIRQGARRQWRHLCQRRLLGCPPRPCFDRRPRPCPAGLCRPHHAGGAGSALRRPR